jgi:streptogramin lyase
VKEKTRSIDVRDAIGIAVQAIAIAMLGALLAPLGAAAHPGHDHSPSGFEGPRNYEPGLHKVGNLEYRYLPGRDEYEVRRPGHGPGFLHPDYIHRPSNDAPNSSKPADSGPPALVGGAVALPSSELNPVCRTSGNRIVVVYTRRSGDPTLAPTATLRSIVKRMNWKISDQSSQSSAGKRVVKMAVECSGGQISVLEVVTASNAWATIWAEVPKALYGYPSGEKAVKYLIFDHSTSVENPAYGGLGGPIFDNVGKSHFNPNAWETANALIFPGAWETHGPIHELIHALGGSQGNASPKAPFSTSGYHCEDGLDILCYADGTGGYFQDFCAEYEGYYTPTTVPIDCNKDTYFNSAPKVGSWLAKYWNIGDRENWFFVAPPKATTEAATSVKGKSAVLHGTADPEGTRTWSFFEWGKTTSYGNVSYGTESNEGPVTVESSILGLLEIGTTYHYRLMTENIDGTVVYGQDKTFTTLTPPMPVITPEAASGVGSTEATLNGTINPKGTATSYEFQYGRTTSYGKVIPAGKPPIGSGESNVKVSQKISFTTEPNTTYHFRLTAANEGGTSYGPDQTFTTPRVVSPPTYVSTFGSLGSGNGQFNSPSGMAIDPEGNIWIVDKGNYRVQKFNSKGEFLLKFGSEGEGNGQFKSAWNIAIDSSGNVWVVESNRVQKFNSKGEFLLKFGSSGSGNGQFGTARDIAIDAKGNVWIVELGNFRVQKFNSKGEFLLKFGSEGEGNGQFTEPLGIASDGDGNIWVADRYAGLQKFDTYGQYLGKVNKVVELSDIAFDSKGTVWAMDISKRIIRELYPEDDLVAQFGKEGSGEGEFKNLLYGIAVDAEDRIWIVDRGNNRVQIWKQSIPYSVETTSATQITRLGATLKAQINPEGKATSYQFEYGATADFGKVVPASPKSIGAGSTAVKISEALTDLKPGTTYYYHVSATGEKGIIYGETRHFSTLPAAGAGAKWRIGGKTLAELGSEKATFASIGTLTIEMPTLSLTFSCSETGSGGKLSGVNAVEEETLTLNCKLLGQEAKCTYKPVTLKFSGTGTELHPMPGWGSFQLGTVKEECPWFENQVYTLPANFALEIGTEAVSLPISSSALGYFGKNPMHYSRTSTWHLTGAQLGNALGFW